MTIVDDCPDCLPDHRLDLDPIETAYLLEDPLAPDTTGDGPPGRGLDRVGRACARHPYRTLLGWLLLAIAVLGLQATIGGDTSDDWRVPGIESQTAYDLLDARFPSHAGWSGRLVFHVDEGRLDEPARRAAIDAALEAERAGADVAQVTDPFDPVAPTVSADGRTAYATVNFASSAPKEVYADEALAAAQVARDAGVPTEVSGELLAGRPVEGQEGIGLGIAMLVLLIAFGSVVAMGVPIATAVIGLVIGFGGIGILAGATDVSTTAPMLASMIGLGVGIDYALFIVTRYRDELRAGRSVIDAVGVAIGTAGQSVVFAGLTVVVAICGLVAVGIPSVTTMGLASAIVVLVSVLAAVTLLPGVLGLIGVRIDRWAIRLPGSRRRRAGGDVRETFAARWAHHIGRRPVRYAIVSFVALVAIAAPVTQLRLGIADDSNTPDDATQHRAHELLSEAFGPGFNGPLVVVVDLAGVDGAAARDLAVAEVAGGLQAADGVAAVLPPMRNEAGDTAVVTVLPTSGPQDAATSDLVAELRDGVLDGAAAPAYVTGHTAAMDDLSARIADRLPWFVGAVVLLSFVLLLVVFRSVLVPLKAAIMNLLSIGAAYGVLVAVFQWGWAAELFGIHGQVPINPFVPMLMFAILFGLSMDYEVFLLSRVREEYLRSRDSHDAVVVGLSSTARVITSAALIMISVFLAFVATPDVTVKMFGIGLATAVLIDATLVRMVLVPSTMALLGRANWWLPAWMDRVLPHLDLEGHHEAPIGRELAR